MSGDINYDKSSTNHTGRRILSRDGADYFPTPEWATRALVDNEKFEGSIWEPACGDGSMSEVLIGAGYQVFSTDLYDRGYGGYASVDFLSAEGEIDNVITNPPFNAAEKFIHKALDVSTNKVAILLRLAFLEGINRRKTIYSVKPPTRVWVFSERITFYLHGVEATGSGTTAFAWFVWDKQNMGQTELKWLPVGYKKGEL